MIKKFKEFNELQGDYIDVRNVIPEYELEDQFLRLEEIFNCDIKIKGYANMYCIFVELSNKDYTYDENIERAQKIIIELKQIKQRLELKYPEVRADCVESKAHFMTRGGVWDKTKDIATWTPK